jgi:hypothetical protein
MYICSYRSKRVGVLICLRRVIVSSVLPYSCLQLSICSAYAERGSLFLMYYMCSSNLDFNIRLVCPTYALWQVLHVIIYIPLFFMFLQPGCCYWFYEMVQCCCIIERYAYNLIFFNKLVIFLIFGPWKVNVVQISLSFLLVFCC